MFSSAIKAVNANSTGVSVQVVSSINKRSKVCDADANGNVNANCKR
jgi:hypothetical protein